MNFKIEIKYLYAVFENKTEKSIFDKNDFEVLYQQYYGEVNYTLFIINEYLNVGIQEE